MDDGIGGFVTGIAVGMWTHPVEVVFTSLMAVALAIVGRRRKLGWCLGLTAQSTILVYGIVTANAGYYPAGIAVVIYLRHLWLRRGESWGAIPTARELARQGCRCTTCCVHGTGNIGPVVLHRPPRARTDGQAPDSPSLVTGRESGNAGSFIHGHPY